MKFPIVLLVISLTIFACSKDNNSENEDNPIDSTLNLSDYQKDSIYCFESNLSVDTFPKINYERIFIDNMTTLLNLKKEYAYSRDNKWKNKAFLTLNRKELRFLRIGDTVIIPDIIISDMRAYSVYPQFYCEARELAKLIMVSNEYQCYAAYEYGRLKYFAAANTGKEKTPTFPGRYALVWKDRIRKSSLDSTWILPFTWNFHKFAGNAFHQFEMPGRAVSHSCVRQFLSDAEWLFNWGRGVRLDSNKKQIWMSGTPVIIQGVFDYKRKIGPWIDLNNNKDNRITLKGNPMDVEEAYIPIAQIPEVVRNWLPNKKRYEVAEDTLRARGIIAEGVKLIPSIDFNKLRREKKKKKLQDSIQKAQKQLQNEEDQLDLELIKNNLKKLNNSKIDTTKKD